MNNINIQDKLYFNKNDYQMMEHEEEFIFTSCRRFKWFKTSRTGYDILMKLNGDKTIEEVISEISLEYELDVAIVAEDICNYCSDLRSEKIIETHNDDNHYALDQRIKSVYIDITNMCNLSCDYCNKNAPSDNENLTFMSVNDFKNIITKLLSNNSDVIPIVYITGGEPLLHPNLERILKIAKVNDIEIFLWTNGTLITDENIKWLKQYCNTIILSIDGSCADINDSIRGKGVFEKIISACNICSEHKLPFLLAATPNKKNNDDLKKLYSLAYNLSARGFFLNEPIFLNVKGLDISHYFMNNLDAYNKIDEELTNQSILVRSWKNNQLKQLGNNSVDTIYFKDTQRCVNSPVKLEKKESCGAGINEISIDVSGVVYPCHVLHNQLYQMGRYEEYFAFREAYSAVKLSNNKDCKKCLYWIFCLGGCKGKTLFHNKDINTKSPNCSKIKKEYFNFLTSPLQPKIKER